MSSFTQTDSGDLRILTVAVTDDDLSVGLMDGRTITVPLAWYPRLMAASPEARARWQIAGAGQGLHWPEIDEDLSTEGLLRGQRPPIGSEHWKAKPKQ